MSLTVPFRAPPAPRPDGDVPGAAPPVLRLGRLELDHDLSVLHGLSGFGDEVADGAAARRTDVVPDAEHLDVADSVALRDWLARAEAVGD